MREDGTSCDANEDGYLVLKHPWPGMARTVWGDPQRYVDTYNHPVGMRFLIPLAPGASGNIVTEDLVFLLESQGLRTGINFEALFAARQVLAQALPEVELYGFTPDAGLPKDFVPATAQ